MPLVRQEKSKIFVDSDFPLEIETLQKMCQE